MATQDQQAVQLRWQKVANDVVPAQHIEMFRWLGPIIGLFSMMMALPFVVGLVILTKITSRGSGIYRQTRVGLKGSFFQLYKIRTMVADAEAKTGPVWTAAVADPRITSLGRVLRASHLDELPQLFNVLRGDMAIIGPRPERPEFTEVLEQKIPGFAARLAVHPGITGLAQITLPPDSDVEGARKKLELDLEYITHSTFLLDIKILFCTVLKMLGLRSYGVAKWLGLVSWRQGQPDIRATWRRRQNIHRGEIDENRQYDDDSHRAVAISQLVENDTATDDKAVSQDGQQKSSSDESDENPLPNDDGGTTQDPDGD
ncbi:MAG: sugar transferase [Planctomycetales bacterium]